MKILFTQSKLPLSVAIRAVTGEKTSHCALDFGSFIAQSNLLGINIEWANFFKRQCTVVYTLERVVPDDVGDLAIFDKIMTSQENSYYDITALLFDCFALLAHKYLKLPLPKRNWWEISGQHMCTEFAEELVGLDNDALITPEGLYNKLKASGKWKDSNG